MNFSELFTEIRLARLSIKIGISLGILLIGYVLSLAFSYYNYLKIRNKLPDVSELAVVSTEITQKIIITFEHQTQLYENAAMTGKSDVLKKAEKKSSELGELLKRLNSLDGISANTKTDILSILARITAYTEEASSVYFQLSKGQEVSIEKTAHLAAAQTEVGRNLTDLAIAIRRNL